MADQTWFGNTGIVVAEAVSGRFVPSNQVWTGSTGTVLAKAFGGSFSKNGIITGLNPDPTISEQFQASVIQVRAWVDIYEQDGTTPFSLGVPITDGAVTVDMDRDERRNFQFTFADDDGSIGYGPGAFWYDKVIKLYRGIVLVNGDTFASPLGVFMPDNITRPYFPRTVDVSCRDYVKKLTLSKFPVTTTFAASTNIATVIQTIATNGGIVLFDFDQTSEVLNADTTFERGTPRWTAITDLAEAIGFEVFFGATGAMRFRPYVDPVNDVPIFTFQTGATVGNLVSYSLSTSDSFLYNDVIVYGDGTDNELVFGRATNTNVSSPTRVSEIGERLNMVPSQHVTDDAKAVEVAQALLNVQALEQYDVDFGAMVIPWLEAGDVVSFIDPNAAPGDPTKFMLSNFSIPLGLGSMSGGMKRVTLVGS